MTTDNTATPYEPLEWYRHATERMNYWESLLDVKRFNLQVTAMVNAWQRQRMIAWGQMTEAERKQHNVTF